MPLPPLTLSLQIARFPESAVHRAALPRHRVRRWLRHAMQADVAAAEFTVRVVGEAEGLALNATWRQREYATNVLTFGYDQAPQVSADLVLCGPVVAREAVQQHKALQAHYAHLVVHGALHAQGWDHETSDADAKAMEAREAAILARLGFANPYAGPA
ncbi:MAG: rRNA maturation RNase YbeY [Ottowia sp.]|nr:rRNA maturation RNase YbeY [Ottowia sp.]